MSTLKATNLSHASAASPNIVLDSAGKVTFGGAVAGAGMDLITPTSVAGTGVTVSGGEITFAAATSISVNGCFTSAYDNYRISVRITTSPNANISFRMRLAGTDSSASTYQHQRITGEGSSVAATGTATQTSAICMYGSGECAAEMTVFSPALAVATFLLSQNNSASTAYAAFMGDSHQTNTAYDGISFIPASGNMTGKLRVYGLRNS